MPEPTPVAHYPFMTDVPGRRVKVKVHKTLGQAKNAIIGSRPTDTALLYRWATERENGYWVELFQVEPGTPKDQMPWVDQAPRLYLAEQTVTARRTIRVMAHNRQEAQRKYLAGEWDAGDWVEESPAHPWGWR